MTGRRAAASVIAVALVLVLSAARPVAALPILEPADADELAAELAEAAEVQGICYGWEVTVDDQATNVRSVDVGSSRGAGLDVRDPSCPRWMVFQADLTYTPSSSESEDSAAFRVWTNVGGAPDESDLRRVGITGDALLGSADDLAVINATLALPALAAERRLAPALPVERDAGDVPPTDGPTNPPGPDWSRTYGHFILLAVAFVVGGLGWAGWAWLSDRYQWHFNSDDE